MDSVTRVSVSKNIILSNTQYQKALKKLLGKVTEEIQVVESGFVSILEF